MQQECNAKDETSSHLESTVADKEETICSFSFPSSNSGNIDVVKQSLGGFTVTKSENKIQFCRTSSGNGSCIFVPCKSPLHSSGEGSFWKITVNFLPNFPISYLFLGIIGDITASQCSVEDSTSYGWMDENQVCIGGTHRTGDWTGFTQGECLYFHLKSNQLTMYSVQKNRKFSIDIAATECAYYIHFNTIISGTKWTLEPLVRKEERAQLL